ncbi:MAG: hypothetical protein Q4P25_01660 [Tissierellia bacterium]|nr:hypothetical protein [Tissierellia bacterium]
MRKFALFAFEGEEMCFNHVLLNALDLDSKGYSVKIIFEGASVTLPPVLEKKEHPLYLKCKEKGLIAGVCEACSRALDSYEAIKELDLPFLKDMKGHPSFESFIKEGYEIIRM